MIASLEWGDRIIRPYSTENKWFLHEFDSRNFLWDINDREDRKVPGLSVWLPFALRFANSDAALEIAIDAAEIADQLGLLGADSLHDAVEADVLARPLRDGSERMRISADLSPPPHDSMHARSLPVQMAARIVEAEALPASELVEIEVPTAPAAGCTETTAAPDHPTRPKQGAR
jgi:hypothetical protein